MVMYTITLTDLLGNKDNLGNKFSVVEMNPLGARRTSQIFLEFSEVFGEVIKLNLRSLEEVLWLWQREHTLFRTSVLQ